MPHRPREALRRLPRRLEGCRPILQERALGVLRHLLRKQPTTAVLSDFIVVTRDKDGREVIWLAETKGEIRPNTALKTGAARLWCEKMSGTKYGKWRYLFVAQRDFEKPSVSNALTLRELADRLNTMSMQ